MKSFFLFVLLFGVCGFTSETQAQDFIVPENIELKTKEDFVKTEKDVINASKWLELTPIGKEMGKRSRVNAFVLMWVTNSPTVSIVINRLCTDLSDKNPDLIAVFLASYCRYVLENYYSTDDLKGNTAGVRGMINCYNLRGSIKRNQMIEKAATAETDGRLEEWVKENMK